MFLYCDASLNPFGYLSVREGCEGTRVAGEEMETLNTASGKTISWCGIPSKSHVGNDSHKHSWKSIDSTCVCVRVCVHIWRDRRTTSKCHSSLGAILVFETGSLTGIWSLPSQLGRPANESQGSACLPPQSSDFKCVFLTWWTAGLLPYVARTLLTELSP